MAFLDDLSYQTDSHDFNDTLDDAEGFTEQFPNWETEPVFENWSQYVQGQMGKQCGAGGLH